MFQAAVVDVEGGDLDPVRLWNCALKATDRAQAQAAAAEAARKHGDHDKADEAEACVASSRAKVADALSLLLHEDRQGGEGRKALDRADLGSTPPGLPASRDSHLPHDEPLGEGEFIYGLLSRGDEPLGSYHAAYWPSRFPVLAP